MRGRGGDGHKKRSVRSERNWSISTTTNMQKEWDKKGEVSENRGVDAKRVGGAEQAVGETHEAGLWREGSRGQNRLTMREKKREKWQGEFGRTQGQLATLQVNSLVNLGFGTAPSTEVPKWA